MLSVAYWILRYRYLTEYSRLPPEPPRKEPHVDLFPDSQEGDAKPGLQNYLDEVLSQAILLMVVSECDQGLRVLGEAGVP